jgi:hypothetical protein
MGYKTGVWFFEGVEKTYAGTAGASSERAGVSFLSASGAVFSLMILWVAIVQDVWGL